MQGAPRAVARRAGSRRSARRPAGAAVVFLLLTSAACGEAGFSVEDVRGRGFLRAGYSEEPPYAFVDGSGRVAGESPEALRAAATAVGIEDIRWVRLDFRDLIPALEQGRVDVVAAGMFRTADRERRIRFSRPTSCSGPALVVRGGDRRFRDILDVRDSASARIAVLHGSVEQAALRSLGVPSERMLLTPDVQTALVAVAKKEAEALAITAPTARWLANSHNGFDVVPYAAPRDVAHLLRACSALAFRPLDARLATSLDSAHTADLRSPERRRLLRGYGFADPSQPGAPERANHP